jgi:hypothetical protein
MAGHSRSKNGVASLAYARPSTSCRGVRLKTWMPGTRPGMTEVSQRFFFFALPRFTPAIFSSTAQTAAVS